METSSFLWSKIGYYSIYCKNGGNRDGNTFKRERTVRITAPKFHGDWIYVELFKDLFWNLFDLMSGNFGVLKAK